MDNMSVMIEKVERQKLRNINMLKTAPHLDVASYVDALGGRHKVVQMINKRFATAINIGTVHKWIARNSVPGTYLLLMQIIGNSKGVDIFKYLKDPV